MPRDNYNYVSLEISDYSGGLNSNPLSSQIKDNEASDCQNIIWYDGSLQMVPGFVRHSAQIGGSGSSTRITGIVDFQLRDGSQFLVSTTEDDILYYNTTTSKWTSIKGALTVTDTLQQFVIANDKLIGTDYTNATWIWDGTGNAAALTGSPPDQSKYIASFNSRVCLGNCVVGGAHTPASVYFSTIDDPESWDTALQEWSFDTDDGQEITGMKQLGEKFIVFKSNSIGYVSGYDLQDWTVNRDWIKSTGCVSGYTVQTGFIVTEGILRQVLIFLSQEGLKALDESGNVYHLPVPAQGEEYKCFEYFDDLNQTGFSQAIGTFYRKRNWSFMFYRNANSSSNDAGCIYDYTTNSLWPLEDIRASAAANVYNETTGEWELFIGTEDGVILKLSETTKGVETDTELFTDGDMETDPATNWESYGTPATKAAEVGTVYQGTKSIKIITDAVDEGIYQDVTTVIGQRYRVYAYGYTEASSDVLLCKEDVAGTNVVSGTELPASTSWTQMSLTFTATSTTSRIIFKSSSDATSTFYIDDASVRSIEVDSYWQSKFYDFGQEYTVKLLREFVALASATDTGGLTVSLLYGKNDSIATSDTVSLTSDSLDWDEDLDWAAAIDWDSAEELSQDLENITETSFRTLQFKIDNNIGCSNFKYNRTLMTIKSLGDRFFYGT